MDTERSLGKCPFRFSPSTSFRFSFIPKRVRAKYVLILAGGDVSLLKSIAPGELLFLRDKV